MIQGFNNLEATFTCDVNKDVLQTILGEPQEDVFTLCYTVYVQARKHKKKRINKKWLKKYGMKEVLIKSDGWEYKDGAFRKDL